MYVLVSFSVIGHFHIKLCFFPIQAHEVGFVLLATHMRSLGCGQIKKLDPVCKASKQLSQNSSPCFDDHSLSPFGLHCTIKHY